MEGSSATSVRCRSVPGVFQRQSRCFKEWAIHAGVTHHLVEKVMEEEAVKTPAMKEVLAEVAKVRAEAGWCWTIYRCPSEKRSNNCLLCAGKDKDGLNLSLDPRKLWQVKVYNKSFYSILIGRKILRHPPITFFFQKFPAKTCTSSLFAGEILLRQLLL